MEIKEVYKKLNNLLDLQNRRDLTSEEEKKLENLKKLRNLLDPDWHKRTDIIETSNYNRDQAVAWWNNLMSLTIEEGNGIGGFRKCWDLTKKHLPEHFSSGKGVTLLNESQIEKIWIIEVKSKL